MNRAAGFKPGQTVVSWPGARKRRTMAWGRSNSSWQPAAARRATARKIRLRGRTLFLLALLLYCLVLAARAEWQIYHLRRELALAQERRQGLLEQRQTLEKELRRLADPAYLERVAREELGLVRPGEVLIIPGDRLSQP